MTPKRLSETRLKEIRDIVTFYRVPAGYVTIRQMAQETLADRDAILDIAAKALTRIRDFLADEIAHNSSYGEPDEGYHDPLQPICDAANAALKELAQGD